MANEELQLLRQRALLNQSPLSDLGQAPAQQEEVLDTSAELVDRLRAFRERRMGQTPSNQFQKLELAEAKAANSASGGRVRTKSVRLRDGRLAIQFLNGPQMGKVFDSNNLLVENPLFDRTDELKSRENKRGSERGALDAGTKFTNFENRLEKSLPALRTRLKGEFATFDASRKALPLGKLNGFMAQAVMLNMVAKITENRATDEDRRFVLEAPGKIKQILDKAETIKLPEFRKPLIDQAKALFAEMKRISQDSIKFAISNEAKSLAGKVGSEGYKDRLQTALTRLGGVSPTGEISMSEHELLQADIAVTKAEEVIRNRNKKKTEKANRDKLKARRNRKGKK
jgi:hypothetical protein